MLLSCFDLLSQEVFVRQAHRKGFALVWPTGDARKGEGRTQSREEIEREQRRRRSLLFPAVMSTVAKEKRLE